MTTSQRPRNPEPVCTAPTAGGGGDQPNVLFTPPCACPRCRPDEFHHDRRDDGWLRLPGLAQRKRVERVELGPVGRQALG